jgi:hypothetical protein
VEQVKREGKVTRRKDQTKETKERILKQVWACGNQIHCFVE